MQHMHNRKGFSLTELIISMAIFTILMAGMMALFNGVVKTVRQGYRLMDAFEIGRSTLDVMQRDLEGSFVDTELRDSFKFYGRPEGFMFIGAHGGAQLGRVTYLVTRFAEADNVIDENQPFDTVLGLPGNAVYQAAIAQGVSDARITDLYGVNSASSSEVFDFHVRIELGSVVRYEERNVTDLETFDLQGVKDLNASVDARSPGGAAMFWPEINAYASTPEEFNAERAQAAAGGVYNLRLYEQILSSIRPWNFIGGYGADLRLSLSISTLRESLNAISLKTVQDLLGTKRREIWIRWLAGDSTLGLPSFWKADGADALYPADDFRPDVRDYILADRVVVRAVLLEPDTLSPIFAGNPYGNANILQTDPYFTYMDYKRGERRQAIFWQDSDNLPGYNVYMDNFNFSDFPDNLQNFDQVLLNKESVGSFHEEGGPRLPCFVVPEFWVMMEEGSGQGGDYRHRFTQAIEIPSRTACAASEM